MKTKLILLVTLLACVCSQAQNTNSVKKLHRKWAQSEEATNGVSIAGTRTTNSINANSAIVLDASTNGVSSTELLELGKAQRLQQEKGYCNRAVLKTSVADLKKSFPEYAALLSADDSEFKQMLILRGVLEKEINIAQSFKEVRSIAARLPEQSILDARDADK